MSDAVVIAGGEVPRVRFGGRTVSRGRELASLLLAFGLPFACYLSTVAPTVFNLDSAELTTAAYSGGLVRATGYPLYLMIGRLWSRVPLGDVGYRMNLLSAVFAALTIAVLDHLLRRLAVPGWARFGALGLLACSRYFWAMASTAEVYTLHTLMTALILVALTWFADAPSPLRLAVCTLTVGLSFGNHGATVLLAPACVWFVVRRAGPRFLTPRALAAAAAGLLVGLSLYLYLTLVYLSAPAFNYAGAYGADGVFRAVDLTSARGMWWLVSGEAFAGSMAAYRAAELVGETWSFLGELVRAFVGVGLGPAIVGFFVLRRRNAPLAEALALGFLGTAAFYISYRVIDKKTMFLPAYVVWAVLLAVGYAALEAWLNEGTDRRPSKWWLRALAVAAVLFAWAWNGPLVDLSDDRSAYNRGLSILSRAAPDALIVGWWSTVPVVEYLQVVEGRRPDVEALNRFLIGAEDLAVLVERRLEEGQPVYFDGPPSDLFENVAVERQGPIFRVHALEAPSHEWRDAEEDDDGGEDIAER